MKISHTMDLAQLAAPIGPDATPDEAAVMRDALIGAGYSHTGQVSRSDWWSGSTWWSPGDAGGRPPSRSPSAESAEAEGQTRARQRSPLHR